MSVKLAAYEKPLRMRDLKDGQLAVILDGVHDKSYIGRIVQFVAELDCYITVGGKSGQRWGCGSLVPVRLLEKGETIVVEDN